MSEELWDEDDVMERLKDWSEDDHRNYIYPTQAKSILVLLEKRDKEITKLKASLADSDGILDRLAQFTRPINQTEEE